MNRKETGPARANAFSEFLLVPFLQKHEPALKNLTTDRYSLWPTFDRLRELPAKRQEELMVGFFTEYKIPHGKEAGLFIARLNNMPWYQPEGKPKREELEKATNAFFLRFDLIPPSLLIVDKSPDVQSPDFWQNLFGKEPRRCREETLREIEREMTAEIPIMSALAEKREYANWQKESSKHHLLRNQAYFVSQMARHAVGDALQKTKFILSGDEIMDPIEYAVITAKWIVLQDEMKKKGYTRGNPGQALFNGVFDKGYRFMGDNGENAVVMNMQPFLLEERERANKAATYLLMIHP